MKPICGPICGRASIGFRAEAGGEIEHGGDIGLEARRAFRAQPVELRLAAAVAEPEHPRLAQPFEDEADGRPAIPRHPRDLADRKPGRPGFEEQKTDIAGDAAVAHARRVVEPAQVPKQRDGGATAFLCGGCIEHPSLSASTTDQCNGM
jgi:hypothetical protein